MQSDPEHDLYAPPVAEETTPDPVAGEGPRGIGGWLILPLLGLIVSPIYIAATLVKDYLPIFERDWAIITDPSYELYHPLWAPLVIYELVGSCALGLFSLVALALMFRHDRRFPKLMIGLYLANVGFQTLDLLVAGQIPAIETNLDPAAQRDLLRSIIAALVWIPYFLRSERVRNTFVA